MQLGSANVDKPTDAVGVCVSCDTALPLRDPHGRERGHLWECAKCGARVAAVYDAEKAAGDFSAVRPVKFYIKQSELSAPPRTIYRFAQQQNEEEGVEVDLRAVERHAFSRTVTVVELDETLTPANEPVVAVSRNLSKRGISLVLNRAVVAEHIVVELGQGDSTIQIIARVTRCNPLGPHYDLAAEFVVKAVD
jgi:ribosomal protein L37AE/L43A